MRKRKPFTLAGIGVPAITLFLLTPVFLLALAGCGSASEPSMTAHAVRSIDWRCSDMYDDFSECVITLTDTRQVDCIVYSTNGKQAGLSCDWDHVSGADKEPARRATTSSPRKASERSRTSTMPATTRRPCP